MPPVSRERSQQLRVIRPRRRRRVRVHPDPVRREVHRGRAREVGQPALVERVRDHAGAALPGVRGQDVDDAAPDLALDHRDRHVLGVEERAGAGDRHRPVPELEALLEHAPTAEQSGVVDQDVDPAPGIEHLADVAHHVVLGAHVARRPPSPSRRGARSGAPMPPPPRRRRRCTPQKRRIATAPARSRCRCSDRRP